MSKIRDFVFAQKYRTEWLTLGHFAAFSSRHATKVHKKAAGSIEADGLLLVEMRGIEPLSEKKAVRVSPGALCLLNFPQHERTHALYALVAS